ncbi:TIGR03943 family putative permease subunit [Rhodococcus sp. NPDC058521]|uniref:TIGR03943 family putative permease subunit n=1 Tax=Rhodococcus sp. NPDC058521 TaxID=3346536 RepID=UPI0036506A2A
MSREVANVLLLLTGGALLKITVDGTYVRYVKPGLFPYLLAAGAVIVLLAAVAIARDIRAGRAADDHTGGHTHSARPYWMLLAPVTVVLFVAPPALGASSVGTPTAREEPVVASEMTAFPPLPGGDAPEVPLLDVVQRAARDSTGSLDGREITVSGFAVETSNGGSARMDGTREGLDLARVVIVCCAADARSVRLHLDGKLGEIPQGTWLSVTGVVRPDSAPARTPTLTVTGVERIPAPDNTYAY